MLIGLSAKTGYKQTRFSLWFKISVLQANVCWLGDFLEKYISCIEIMITQKNRLEPTLILQSVDDVTNCKRNQKEKTFFS